MGKEKKENGSHGWATSALRKDSKAKAKSELGKGKGRARLGGYTA
jgi:hypothetical protein